MRSAASDTGAATAIEYALVAGLIAVVIITAISSVGTTISSTFYSAIATAP